MSTVEHRPTPITREGHDRLRAELEHLVSVKRRDVAEWLREARDDGTEPGENPDVGLALDEQAGVERRIDELEAILADVSIAEPPDDGVVGLGQRVVIRMAGGRTPIECRIVGAVESDPAAGRISIESPVARALLGRRAGDEVEVETPGGRRLAEVVAVGDGGA
jgi:transcription elongation factor GreA